MRINDAYTKLQTTQTDAASSAAQGSAATPAPKGGQGVGGAHGKHGAHAKVSVSTKAKSLEADARADEAKVSKLRESIASGTFKIDAQEIARKIVGDGG